MQYAHLQAEGLVDGAHPARIAASEVIIDSHEMDAATGEGVEIEGQRGHQGFSFASTHFGNLAVMEGYAANHLHVIMAQADGAFAGFAHCGKSFRQEFIQRFTFQQAAAKFRGFGGEGLIAEFFEIFFKQVDLVDHFGQFLHLTFIGVQPQSL